LLPHPIACILNVSRSGGGGRLGWDEEVVFEGNSCLVIPWVISRLKGMVREVLGYCFCNNYWWHSIQNQNQFKKDIAETNLST
jgi:hypothetical protein